MFIKLFDVKERSVTPTEHCYVITWLKDIMESYPDNYCKIYAYLQFMSSWNPADNPYLAMEENNREEVILRDIDADFSTEDEIIQLALENCKKMHELPSYRLWLTAKKGLDKMKNYLDSVQMRDGKDGNIADYRATYKDLPNLEKAYNEAYRAFIDDVKMSVRGGKYNSQV